MNRLITTRLCGALTGLLLAGTALAADARILREATVSTDIVRLGNLVEGLDQGADIPLFKAPAPGTRGTIRVERILMAAREYGITNIAYGDVRMVQISRPARTIQRADMAQAISQSMAQRGNANTLDIVLDDHVAPRMVDVARRESLRVMQVNRDPATGRFEAKLALADDQASETWNVTGAVLETREIAVLANDVERGDAIKDKDLTLVRRPANQIEKDAIASAADLIGMVPRRAMRTGEFVRSTDIARPMLVEKNQLVSVTYVSKGLTLSMRGRAQSNGAMGETVRVQNPQSKRFVEGVVSGPGQVTITAPAPATANLAEAR
ncbi:MAG: flagellar basal body P-ring formation chaperone FlgA [Proteobacteria bacterium]|nr:flagellar basal body P-ring formation chaperone FlgA [Pseudomonadota bacterium]